MAVSIRLMRIGKKGNPAYRIVAIDKRKKRNTEYLDKLGFYNPLLEPAKLELDEKKLIDWVNKGAVLSEGAQKLLGKKLRSLKD